MRTLNHNTIKTKAITVLLLSICFAVPLSSQSLNNSEWTDFDLAGGYLPGDICIFEDGQLETPRVPGEYLKMLSVNPFLMGFSAEFPIPKMEIAQGKRKVFEALASGKINKVDVEAGIDIENLNTVTLSLKEGVRYGLTSGLMYLTPALEAMPLKYLEDIQRQLELGKDIRIISEVQEFRDAELEIRWNKELSAGARAKFLAIFKASAGFNDSKQGFMNIKYDEPIRTKYKFWPINKQIKKQIEEIILEKKRSGNTRSIITDCASGDLELCKYLQDQLELSNSYMINDLNTASLLANSLRCDTISDMNQSVYCSNVQAGLIGSKMQIAALFGQLELTVDSISSIVLELENSPPQSKEQSYRYEQRVKKWLRNYNIAKGHLISYQGDNSANKRYAIFLDEISGE